MIICSSCGANMRFDPGLQKLKCEHCGKTQECSNEENRHVIVAESDNDYYEATVFKCPQCGAKLISTDETAGTFCSYCGSSVLIKENICKMQKPDCVIPFSISKEKCEEIYKKHLSKSWFAQEELKKDYVIEKIMGIYMPYWIYNFKGKPSMKFKASKSWHRGDYLYTQHYNAYVKNKSSYEGIIFDSSSNFYDDLSQNISNYNIDEAKSFNEGYLSGFYVDASDVPSSIYEDNARKIITEDAEKIIKKNEMCKKYNCDFSNLGEMFDKTKFDLGYFPVWFLSIKNKRNDRISYATINGSTGKIAMDIPISIPKFLLSLFVIAIIIFFILNAFLMFTPQEMIFASILVNIIGITIINENYNAIYIKENWLNDEGVQNTKQKINEDGKRKNKVNNYSKRKGKSKAKTKNKAVKSGFMTLMMLQLMVLLIIAIVIILLNQLLRANTFLGLCLGVCGMFIIPIYLIIRLIKVKFKMPFSQKIKKMVYPLIGIILSIITLIINFTADEYYYLTELISFMLFGISCINIVKSLNLLASRKLPQFNKRGGDVDE